MSPNDLSIRDALKKFALWRSEFLRGDEKGEAQIFCERLFQAFGHSGVREAGAILEDRIHRFDRGGISYADLMWKPRCLIEMKKVGSDLSRVYRQAFQYWIQAVPDRPRYVVLCNFDEFWVYDFDKQLDEPMDRFRLVDLPTRYDALAFLLPREEPPIFGNDQVSVTREVASQVSGVFRSIAARGVGQAQAQRFVLQSVVAMFSEDIGLLPAHFFTRALDDARDGSDAYDLLGGLFRAMNDPKTTPGGRYAGTPYFNGGLFSHVEPIDLNHAELIALRAAAKTDWSRVQPEVFGTLFEQSMDKGERHAFGAHFTSQADIAKIVQPTIVQPWTDRIEAARTINQLERLLLDMAAFRVLDPACGSGNFLYAAYREMRRLETEVKLRIDERRRSKDLASQTAISYVTPDHFLGMDIKPVAVEVAKVTMMLGKKLAAEELGDHQQVLPLDNLDRVIQARDSLLQPWPSADAIIGNPPYLGRRKMIEELGLPYVTQLKEAHPQVGGVSDFVSYWFPLAHDALARGGRAGLVATQAIRDNDSRKASLDYLIQHEGVIYEAVSSQPWSGDAVVHVSIVNWVKGEEHAPPESILWLDDAQLRLSVRRIPASLEASLDVGNALPLPLNRRPKVTFQGQTTGHVTGFRLTREEASAVIARSPAEEAYIRPQISGDPLIHLLEPNTFVIDLPFRDSLEANHRAPELMRHLRGSVLPTRESAAKKEGERNQEVLSTNPKAKPNRHHENFRKTWWRHGYRREDMIKSLESLDRYIALTRVAAADRRSIYVFCESDIRPDDSLQVFALDDDYSFGILSSTLHRSWFNERCSQLKADPRYTSRTVWDSFPWPMEPSADQVCRVADASAAVIAEREKYLDLGITLAAMYDTLREPGFSQFRKVHEELDDSVYAAYNFSDQDGLLDQLLALNHTYADDPHGCQASPGLPKAGNPYASSYRLTARKLHS